MISAARTRAENHFTAIEKRQKKALSEQEAAAVAVSENTARLKALRLAKEAEDLAEKPVKPAAKKRATARSAR